MVCNIPFVDKNAMDQYSSITLITDVLAMASELAGAQALESARAEPLIQSGRTIALPGYNPNVSQRRRLVEAAGEPGG